MEFKIELNLKLFYLEVSPGWVKSTMLLVSDLSLVFIFRNKRGASRLVFFIFQNKEVLRGASNIGQLTQSATGKQL